MDPAVEAAPDLARDEELQPLTRRQALFVAEYLVDLNATQAAIRAGYSGPTANPVGGQLVHRKNIKAAIEVAQAQRLARVNMTADSVLEEMALLAKSNIEHYVIDDFGNVTLAEGAPAGAMAAIASIKKKVRHGRDGSITYEVDLKLWDKPTPLKLMGRHVGLFVERMEHTGKDGGPIEAVTEIRRIVVRPHEIHDNETVVPVAVH